MRTQSILLAMSLSVKGSERLFLSASLSTDLLFINFLVDILPYVIHYDGLRCVQLIGPSWSSYCFSL